MIWIVGDEAERLALDADEGGDHADAEIAPQLQHPALVGHEIDDLADVIHAQAVLRDRAAQQPLVRRSNPHRALEIGQVFLRGRRRLLLVLDQDVDDAVGDWNDTGPTSAG